MGFVLRHHNTGRVAVVRFMPRLKVAVHGP